ncbi:MAG: hypothetical protein H8E31_02160 [Planctomycetes bacterium]|nr:hypothetical protein [Planctomycetota bacterium]
MTRFPHAPYLKPLAAAFLAAAALASCSGGGNSLSPGEAANAGAFQVQSINMNEGDVWALNRPIVLTFNHPVDPSSLSFTAIIIRPLDPPVQGRPVTGSFTLRPGAGDRVVVFQPACPTDLNNTNGAFVPGGYRYEIALPTQQNFGASVLRDQAGHPLTVGLTREFRTPIAPVEPLFIDTVVGPPRFSTVNPVAFPDGLNLFSDPDSVIAIRFNQSINASSANLNTDRVYALYSDGEIGSGSENTFDPKNKVPGRLLLVNNCTLTGALIYFQIAGILPPNRNLVVRVSSNFEDLAGETNSQVQSSATHATPTLTAYYDNDPAWSESDETADEILEDFGNSSVLDPAAALAFPPAVFTAGQMTASFQYPGVAPPPDHDFVLKSFNTLELSTSGTVSFQDSNGRNFQLIDGVLEVDDLTIEEEAVIIGRGPNPLVIYATGTVSVFGVLDVSGGDALLAQALGQPTVPEPGGKGGPGGGNGGVASASTTNETFRGKPGFGAFNLGLGGGGGEGNVNWTSGSGSGTFIIKSSGKSQIAGGGGGGQFGNGPIASLFWSRFAGISNPASHDNAGPDIRDDRHTHFSTQALKEAYFTGAEDGRRGNSFQAQVLPPPPPLFTDDTDYGGLGMEDQSYDSLANDRDSGGNPVGRGLDPAWTTQADPPYYFGHPSNGADPGFAQDSIFGGVTADDFLGSRWNPYTQTRTGGELTAAWAGAGGGASGDSSLVMRLDLNADNFLDPLSNFFPDENFPYGWTYKYWKGAPGGGGGGQLQIMSIGPIILGPNTRLLANGGSGNGGESLGEGSSDLIRQVSGSGGGSGGHIILQSATGLDLSSIDVGADPVGSPPAVAPELGQAIGGRRGWAYSEGVTLSGGVPDGNSDFMIGRGGAGANGLIQIHVPEPVEDIAWHAGGASSIRDYLQHSNLSGPLDTDRLEEILDLYFEPKPFALIPAFSPKSQFQTSWIDTGLAGLRDPIPANDYPNYASALLGFQGISTATGAVATSNAKVVPLAAIATGSNIGLNGPAYTAFQVLIPSASATFGLTATADMMLRNPTLLVGYDFLPDSTGAATFEITEASYNRGADQLTLTTVMADGSLLLALNPSNPVWSMRPKFFRVMTSGQKSRLPDSAGITFEFQGAAETSKGSNIPGTPTAWTADLANLEGMRFIRYRVTFNIDAAGSGVTVNSERPALQLVKVPIIW